jgi:uncharacterized repeat protein (TIGR03803 family)
MASAQQAVRFHIEAIVCDWTWLSRLRRQLLALPSSVLRQFGSKRKGLAMTNEAQHPGLLRAVYRTPPRTFSIALAAGAVLGLTANARPQVPDRPASHFTVLYAFNGGADGRFPNNFPSGGTGLSRDTHGDLYDTTTFGGDVSGDCAPDGCGVVFKLDTAGKETVLHTFAGPDGALPGAAPVRDDEGNLYGTTYAGGVGFGVVFKLDTAGKETVLYNFSGGEDGQTPLAGVIRDKSGNLYGTTSGGGDLSECNGSGCGVVFKVDVTGKETVLYRFRGGRDGAIPSSGLIRDRLGDLYGTTSLGGISNKCGGLGCGVVFKVDPTGNETVLYRFRGGVDGGQPTAGLVLDQNGNLYGTAPSGGDLRCTINSPPPGCGVVFKLDRAGKETTLHVFSGGTDGGAPYAGLLWRAGNLYGTTSIGGDLSACGGAGCGVLFRLDSRRKETVLHAFTGGVDGRLPFTGLIRDRAGNLYGASVVGGDLTSPLCSGDGCGVVFKLTR